ncbi:MAG: ankyrin repeat domain-containing protein [Candidatus Protochlamydia sp.]|nr:ankyrin repeat domain-containing protein [Candidatus Protochlamydia sp.]
MNINNGCCNSQCLISAENNSNYSFKTILSKKIKENSNLSENDAKIILYREIFSCFNIPLKGNDIYSNPSSSFKKNATPAEFDELMLWMDSYDSVKYSANLSNLYRHALMQATHNQNVPLIKHICTLGSSLLFYFGSREEGSKRAETPLHIASAKIAKLLLQLKCPVNLIENTKDMFDESNATPLDHAIQNNQMEKATLLIRNGGVSISPQTNIRRLNEAVMTKSEILFQLHLSDSITKAKTINIPNEILNQILFFSYNLDKV